MKYHTVALIALSSLITLNSNFAQSIDFTQDQGFTSAPLNGQIDWIAYGPTSTPKVDANKGTVRMEDASIIIFNTPLQLEPGMAYSFTSTFQLEGEGQDMMYGPDKGTYWYLLRLGFKSTNATNFGPQSRTSSELTLQVFRPEQQSSKTSLRLLDKSFTPLHAPQPTQLKQGVDFKISYQIELTDSAETSIITTKINNGSSEMDSHTTGIEQKLYDDFTSGDGAYLFFQVSQLGNIPVNAIVVKSISE